MGKPNPSSTPRWKPEAPKDQAAGQPRQQTALERTAPIACTFVRPAGLSKGHLHSDKRQASTADRVQSVSVGGHQNLP